MVGEVEPMPSNGGVEPVTSASNFSVNGSGVNFTNVSGNVSIVKGGPVGRGGEVLAPDFVVDLAVALEPVTRRVNGLEMYVFLAGFALVSYKLWVDGLSYEKYRGLLFALPLGVLLGNLVKFMYFGVTLKLVLGSAGVAGLVVLMYLYRNDFGDVPPLRKLFREVRRDRGRDMCGGEELGMEE